MRAVQALPGVATGDDFQAGFSVRGSPFRHTGVTIDGVPAAGLLHVVRAEANSGSVSMINTDILSGASLVVGARPARDGDWLGPTLAFDLREGSRDRSGGRVALSGTSASMAVEGPIGLARRGSWLVSLRKSYLDWLVRKVESDFDSTIGFWDGHVKAAMDLGDRQSLEVVVIGGDAAYRERDASAANGLLRARSGSTLAAMRWQHRSARVVAEPSRLFSRNRVPEHGRPRPGAGARLHAGDRLARRRTRAGGQPMARRRREARSNTRAPARSRAGFGWMTLAISLTTAHRSRRFSATSTAAWFEGRRPTDRGSITLGVRGTARSDIDGVSWSPWIAVDRRAGRLTFRAAAGGTTQLPDPLTVFGETETRAAGTRRLARCRRIARGHAEHDVVGGRVHPARMERAAVRGRPR